MSSKKPYKLLEGLTSVYRIISIRPRAGKTSLGALLTRELNRIGVKPTVILQTGSSVLEELNDAFRYRHAGASNIVVSNPEELIMITEPMESLEEIIENLSYYTPLVLVEGFKGANIGKAIAIIEEPREIELISGELGLWYIVSNDLETVETALQQGFNALLIDETEKLAREIYHDAVTQITSAINIDPALCGMASKHEVAEKLLKGIITPSQCIETRGISIIVNNKPVILDDKLANALIGVIEGFLSNVLPASIKPKNIRIELKQE